MTAPFDPREAAFIHQPGPATLSGQAFLRRKDGIVVPAAGSIVRLIPATAHSRERMAALYGGRKFNRYMPQIPVTDPRYFEMMRTTRADGDGRFAFAGLADGDYYLTTRIEWEFEGLPRGGALMETARIRQGKDLQLILSGE